MLSFSIIIVSWNALEHLKTYLPSVMKTDYPDFEILLADNASTDGSVEWVKREFPRVRVVALNKNYGYCGGNNRAARHARGQVLVFLNNDVAVESDWLTELNNCFAGEADTAALQPRMLSHEQPDRFEYAGAAGGYLDRYGYPFCRGRIFETVEKDTGQYDDAVDLLWASGAALAVRRRPFEELGGFDEDFEFHMEEIDLCWQLWNRGYKVRFCPASVVYHLGGGSLPMGSSRKVYYNYRNNLKMLWKNCSSGSLARRFSVRYALDIVAALRALVTGNFRDFKAILRAHLHFWLSFPHLQRQRARLQKARTVATDPPTLLPLNLITEYFWRGHRTFRELI